MSEAAGEAMHGYLQCSLKGPHPLDLGILIQDEEEAEFTKKSVCLETEASAGVHRRCT